MKCKNTLIYLISNNVFSSKLQIQTEELVHIFKLLEQAHQIKLVRQVKHY